MGNLSGGIADLGATLREYQGVIEVDFHTHYGIEDFDDAMAKGCRWVWVRIKHLPPDAALWRVLQAEPEQPKTVNTTDKNEISAFLNQHDIT